ncbi:MAG: ThiF family adenylyltransferase, partial [Acidimicrobiia bacterium]
MPAELRLTTSQFAELREQLLPNDAERAALLVCGTAGEDDLLLCRRVIQVAQGDLESSGPLHLHISPIALARAAKQARNEQGTLVVCHSHPFSGTVRASSIDIETETELCGRVLPGRLDRRPVGALIIGPDGYDGRLWRSGTPRPLMLAVGGRHAGGGDADPAAADDRAARQVLLWGAQGQRRIRDARVVVVGAGGTGSHVVTQLAHLGVGHLVIIDHDVVERSNLSRLIGA